MSYQDRLEAMKASLLDRGHLDDVENIGRRALKALGLRDEASAREVLSTHGKHLPADAGLHDIAVAVARVSRASVVGPSAVDPVVEVYRAKKDVRDFLRAALEQNAGRPWLVLLRDGDAYFMAQPVVVSDAVLPVELSTAELLGFDHEVTLLPMRDRSVAAVAVSDLKKGMQAFACLTPNGNDDQK